MQLITDKDGKTYLAFGIETAKQEPKAKRTRTRVYTDFALKIGFGNEDHGEDTIHFDMNDCDDFVAEYIECLNDYEYVYCEVIYHHRDGGLEESEIGYKLPYSRETKLSKKVFDKLEKLGLPLIKEPEE